MSTEGRKATAAAANKASVASEETPEREVVQHQDEGVGVFRALMLTALLYIAFGFLIWFGWNLFRQWRGH